MTERWPAVWVSGRMLIAVFLREPESEPWLISWFSDVRGVHLSDERLNVRIVERLGEAPNLSIPAATRSPAEMEDTYRFFSNENISAEKIRTPHAVQWPLLTTLPIRTTKQVHQIVEHYCLRWQIELFFKELKSTLGVGQYQFERFEAVEAWMNCAITAVLFLEHERAKRLRDRRLSEDRHRWWMAQRLHGLCEAFRQECVDSEL